MTDWGVERMPNLTGRTAVVTGANSGIGFATAAALARAGAHVVLACRDAGRGEAAAERIRESDGLRGEVEFAALDLSSLDSVRGFAEKLSARFRGLDLLCNNAGVMMLPLARTAEGFELQLGTNHLGHFALTGLLLELLVRTPGARVVTVSSIAHRVGRIAFEDLNAERSYNRVRAYGQSKLANLLFTFELQRRLARAGHGVLAAAAHPGWTATNLQAHIASIRWVNPFFAQTPERGALPTLYAASAPDVSGGDYFGPRGAFEMWGTPTRVGASARAHHEPDAKRLWEASEALTGVRFL